MTEITIDLDRKHRAIRSGERWAVQRRQTDGSWDMIAAWDGGRRSLIQWAQNHDVHLTREAEQVLDNMPEGRGFKDR